MCVVETRTIIHSDGRREIIEERRPCAFARGNKLCGLLTRENREERIVVEAKPSRPLSKSKAPVVIHQAREDRPKKVYFNQEITFDLNIPFLGNKRKDYSKPRRELVELVGLDQPSAGPSSPRIIEVMPAPSPPPAASSYGRRSMPYATESSTGPDIDEDTGTATYAYPPPLPRISSIRRPPERIVIPTDSSPETRPRASPPQASAAFAPNSLTPATIPLTLRLTAHPLGAMTHCLAIVRVRLLAVSSAFAFNDRMSGAKLANARPKRNDRRALSVIVQLRGRSCARVDGNEGLQSFDSKRNVCTPVRKKSAVMKNAVRHVDKRNIGKRSVAKKNANAKRNAAYNRLVAQEREREQQEARQRGVEAELAERAAERRAAEAREREQRLEQMREEAARAERRQERLTYEPENYEYHASRSAYPVTVHQARPRGETLGERGHRFIEEERAREDLERLRVDDEVDYPNALYGDHTRRRARREERRSHRRSGFWN
ncbi:hypothetical protein H2203_007735 [Taxawa tesnikishii (nom. ined.)]|nr:hypothetical protein H2203_007735 [Dothideales sp. JES 119]